MSLSNLTLRVKLCVLTDTALFSDKVPHSEDKQKREQRRVEIISQFIDEWSYRETATLVV